MRARAYKCRARARISVPQADSACTSCRKCASSRLPPPLSRSWTSSTTPTYWTRRTYPCLAGHLLDDQGRPVHQPGPWPVTWRPETASTLRFTSAILKLYSPFFARFIAEILTRGQGEAEITSPPPRRTMRYGHEKQSTDGRGRRRSPRLLLAEPGPDRVQLRAKRRRRLRRLHLLDARAA